MLAPGDPLFTTPERDRRQRAWKGWVQERGLYFLGESDPRYRDLVEFEDHFRTTRARRPARWSKRRMARDAGCMSGSACGGNCRRGPTARISCWPTSSRSGKSSALRFRAIRIRCDRRSIESTISWKYPLTPLEFARRARALYADREAVVDGDAAPDLRAVLRALRPLVGGAAARSACGQGDRVAYIAPNTHAQLESFYAVPQIGAVLVPINYRLTADDFAYIINHSGATVVCAHADYLDAVDGIRAQLPDVEHFVALEGARDGWLDYEALLATRRRRRSTRPAIDETRPADDQLHQRHDLAPQGRDDHASQRLHERGRHAGARADDAGRPLPVDAADVPRQRLDLRLDRDRGRRRRTSACARSIRRASSSSIDASGSRCCAPRRRC